MSARMMPVQCTKKSDMDVFQGLLQTQQPLKAISKKDFDLSGRQGPAANACTVRCESLRELKPLGFVLAVR